MSKVELAIVDKGKRIYEIECNYLIVGQTPNGYELTTFNEHTSTQERVLLKDVTNIELCVEKGVWD